MDFSDFPEWLKLAASAGLGSLGTLVAGVFRARSDSKRVRTDDRVQFTAQLMERLHAVEQHSQQLRESYRAELLEQAEKYEQRLASRDTVITELRDRVSHLERVLQGLD